MRRLARALAALAVVAGVLLVGAPARAESGCSAAEWANPANFARCTTGLGVDLGHLASCLTPPTPDSPDAGSAGWVGARPESDLHDGVAGRWSRYGVAGYQLSLYDVTCVVGQPTDVGSSAGNAVGDWAFTGAATVLGASNRLRETAFTPGGMWSFLDGPMAAASSAVFHHVFTVYGAVALALLGLLILWRARVGNLSETLGLVWWALLVVVTVTSVCAMPLLTVHGADRVAATGLSLMHGVLGPAPQSLPAGQCPDVSPGACVDHRSAATRASDVAVEAILYRNWLRAEFGSPDSASAVKYGPALFDAQTLTWDEAATVNAHPELRQQILDGKARQWAGVAAQVKAEDPAAYESLRGRRGTARMFTGLLALGSAVVFAVFDTLMSVIILLGFLVFRWSVVILPLAGTLGVVDYTSAWFRKTVNAVVSSAAGIVAAGALSGAYLMVACLVFESGLPGFVQTSCVALCGAVGVALAWRIRGLVRIPGWRRSEKTVTRHVVRGAEWASEHDDDMRDGARRAAAWAAGLVGGVPGAVAAQVVRPPVRPETTAGGRR